MGVFILHSIYILLKEKKNANNGKKSYDVCVFILEKEMDKEKRDKILTSENLYKAY